MKSVGYTFIIPVYNVEQYLERCVISVVNQNYESDKIQILLIDDGSTDSSPELCDRLSATYKNVTSFHKENGGLSDARNYGLLRAANEYIVFLDSDDYVSDDLCSQISSYINANVELPDIIAGGVVKHIGNNVRYIRRHFNANLSISGIQFLKGEFESNTFFVISCASVYRRDFLLDNDLMFLKGELHEDEDFTIKAFASAKNVISTDVLFYHYVIRDNSITTNKNKIPNAKSIFKISRGMLDFYETISDKRLTAHLRSHTAKICYKIIEDAALYEKANQGIIDITVLKKSSVFLKEKIRYLILRISPRLLHWFNCAFKRRRE